MYHLPFPRYYILIYTESSAFFGCKRYGIQLLTFAPFRVCNVLEDVDSQSVFSPQEVPKGES